MSTPQECAKMIVVGLSEFIAANREAKADIGAEIVDLLFGTDSTALVSKVPGLTPTMFEMLTDAMKEMIRDKIKNMMAEEEE
jgi:hypothetical protein